METVDILKVLSYPIILGLAMVPGVIPLFCPCCSRNKRCLANTHTFSGGVFITMGLLHIFPESVVEFHEQYPDLAKRFPIPEALFIFGYCLVMIFEKVVCGGHHHCDHEDEEHAHAHAHAHAHGHGHGHAHGHAHGGHGHGHKKGHQHGQKQSQDEINFTNDFHHHFEDHNLLPEQKQPCLHAQNEEHIGCELANRSDVLNLEKSEYVLENAPLSHDMQDRGEPVLDMPIPQLRIQTEVQRPRKENSKQLLKLASSGKQSMPWLEVFLNRADTEQCKKKNCEKKCNCLQETQKTPKPKKKNTGCWADSFIILSLSIHTFFEGLALGVLSNQSEVFSLLIGIILHNWAESLSIGAALAKRDEKREHRSRAVLLLFIYAILSPIGISIGWALLKFSQPIVAILASAVSGGTFLYVGATEVVNEDFKGSRLCAKSFYYLLGGIVIMAATAVTENTTEGHSH